MTTITNGESGASVRTKLNAALAVTDTVPADLAAKAPLASPAFTGTPTAPTAALGTNTTQLATTAFIQAAIAALLNSAPGALDTLDELAAALGDDANFAATMTAALAGKAAVSHTHPASQISDSTAAGRSMLTAANAAAQTALLNAFTSALKGLVPASGGGTTNYLRADGTWAAPPGGGATGTTFYNGTGGTLARGTPIALGAFDAGSGNPGMAAADADGAGLMPCIGILGAAVNAGASGIPVITGGEITGLDTSAWTLGDKLYVSTAGALTNVRPTAGFIQSVAVVSRVDAAAGEIIVALEEAGELYTEVLERAISDEVTNLGAGTAKLTFRMPFGFNLTGIRASVNTAPVGSAITVGVNLTGIGSILSTDLTIDDGEKTSVTAAVPAVISVATLADDAEITVDIDTVGSTTPGKGLKLLMLGYRT
jgi:hypothetical protein